MKICTRCKIKKSTTEFWKKSNSDDRLRSRCINCCNETRIPNKEAKKDYDKLYRQENGLKKFSSMYKIPEERLIEAFDKSDGLCEICKKPETSLANYGTKSRRLAIDHCHTTGEFRGLLCANCNQGLGRFKDNIESLENAINYLKKNK